MGPVPGTVQGKVVLVTGGTGGIGLATATGLAGLGARVGIAGRSATRGDQSSQAQVRRLAAEVRGRYDRLDVLVNNVGGYWAHRHVTADGLEHTFAVNHLAPFLLIHELRDLLVASAPARVVTVSSAAQSMGRIDLDDLRGERSYNGRGAYSASKLANVLFTYEPARRLEGTGVTATAAHPGVVRTGFGGAYFANRRPSQSSRAGRDRGLARSLWEASAALTGVDATAPIHRPRRRGQSRWVRRSMTKATRMHAASTTAGGR